MMYNFPKTKSEAEQHYYGKWSGNPRGDRYKPECCAYEVMPDLNGGPMRLYQCSRAPRHGPDNLYCKQHAKKVVKYLERQKGAGAMQALFDNKY